jgi:NAD(P) transhydrogenase subunit alpha
MIFGVPAETRVSETRVAASPETVKKLTAAGARIVASAADAYGQAAIVVRARGPDTRYLPARERFSY